MPKPVTNVEHIVVPIAIVGTIVVFLLGVIFALIKSQIKTMIEKLQESKEAIEKVVENHHLAILDIYSTVNTTIKDVTRLEEQIKSQAKICERNHK